MMPPKAFKWIKVSGLLALLPIVLAVGPLTGYIAGDWLVTYFKLPPYITIICVILGFAAAVQESIRIIKAALHAAKDGSE